MADSAPNNTEAAKLGLNLTLTPVEEFVFQGVQQRILTLFNAPSVWTTADDKVKALSRLFKDRAVQYPHVFLTLNSWARAADRGNARQMAMRGAQSVITTNQRRTFRVHFIPVDFMIGVEFVTNSADAMKAFGNRWLFAAQNGWMKFTIEYGRSVFSVGAELTDNVSFPLRNADPGEVQEYIVSTDMKVQGYISNHVLLEQQIVDKVSIDGVVGAEGGKVADGTTVWTFKKSGITHEFPSGSDGPPKGIG